MYIHIILLITLDFLQKNELFYIYNMFKTDKCIGRSQCLPVAPELWARLKALNIHRDVRRGTRGGKSDCLSFITNGKTQRIQPIVPSCNKMLLPFNELELLIQLFVITDHCIVNRGSLYTQRTGHTHT